MVSVISVLFGGVPALVGGAMLVVAASGFRKWRAMRGRDPSDLVVEPGLREFEGRAYAIGEPATAPFSGNRSLICGHEVERYNHDDRDSNWDTVSGGVETVPFEIEHMGHTVAVDPERATYLLTEDFHVDTGTADELPPRVREYVEGTLDTGATVEIGPIEFGGRRYRFTEERLDEGEEVYVLGPISDDPSSVPPGSDARLVIAPGERGLRRRLLGDPFVVSDTGAERAAERQLKRAIEISLIGLVFAGVGTAVILLV